MAFSSLALLSPSVSLEIRESLFCVHPPFKRKRSGLKFSTRLSPPPLSETSKTDCMLFNSSLHFPFCFGRRKEEEEKERTNAKGEEGRWEYRTAWKKTEFNKERSVSLPKKNTPPELKPSCFFPRRQNYRWCILRTLFPSSEWIFFFFFCVSFSFSFSFSFCFCFCFCLCFFFFFFFFFSSFSDRRWSPPFFLFESFLHNLLKLLYGDLFPTYCPPSPILLS